MPQTGIIPALEKVDITLRFKPTRISEKFYELIKIEVPN
jgi:hypothetical protein